MGRRYVKTYQSSLGSQSWYLSLHSNGMSGVDWCFLDGGYTASWRWALGREGQWFGCALERGVFLCRRRRMRKWHKNLHPTLLKRCSYVQLWVLSKREPSSYSSYIPATSFHAGLFALDFCWWVETAMLVLLQIVYVDRQRRSCLKLRRGWAKHAVRNASAWRSWMCAKRKVVNPRSVTLWDIKQLLPPLQIRLMMRCRGPCFRTFERCRAGRRATSSGSITKELQPEVSPW